MKKENDDELYGQTWSDNQFVGDDDQSQYLKYGRLMKHCSAEISLTNMVKEEDDDNDHGDLYGQTGADNQSVDDDDQSQCLKCGALLPSLEYIMQHMKTNCQNIPQSTNQVFTSNTKVDIQLKMENDSTDTNSHHIDHPVIPPEWGETDIQKQFTKVKKTIRNHTGQHPYSHPECNKSLSRYSHLKQHLGIECNKSFCNSGNLTTHLRPHKGEHLYSCSECNKSFSTAGHLKRHLRFHTGERPYGCSECDKSFAQSWHLKEHLRTHTGERPYICSECNKSFRHRGSLTVHMRSHTGEGLYSCKECNKSFCRASGLKQHLRTHPNNVISHSSQLAT